ncbi:tRNA (adenosine(37)-N6)-dimethylallyltransferase MiaA [Rhodosalinus halophilus]|nr:tRNA (adenosine(37)-N6)-dimethylallyltransferase MiaA [Rhodosalinus halophilus]
MINLPADRHVLIAGPTASGKSALALALAERQGGVIVNADAIQVYRCWRVLSARPSAEEEARAPHALYGFLDAGADYSVGQWLRDLAPLLRSGARLIVTGGTGLYFSALTEGLAEIPPVPDDIRAEARARRDEHGIAHLLAELDAETAARIDQANPARVLRAWEVLRATGRGLARWQAETGPPLLPLGEAVPLRVDAPRDWLAARIERRFDAMLAGGALDEVRALLPDWRPDLPAAKAIGAPELAAHLRGEMTLAEARARAVAATRRFAKRQRTWFRARMRDWTGVDARDL